MREKAEEWAGRTEWMSRVNGQEVEVEQGRLVWELLACPPYTGCMYQAWIEGSVSNTVL